VSAGLCAILPEDAPAMRNAVSLQTGVTKRSLVTSDVRRLRRAAQMTTKQRIAREWLIFLPTTAVGFAATYFLYFFHTHVTYSTLDYYMNASQSFDRMLDWLFSPPFSLSTWCSILSLYLSICLVRSIIWAVRTLRTAT
jgi:hypothetical protein